VVNDRLLLSNAQKYEYENRIAPLKNLKNIPIWIFSGTQDTTVYHSIVNKTYNFFKGMGVKDLTYVNDMATTHSFPTTDDYAPKKCNGNNF
jgi:alpha-beta hydrolase superfamily lysophospholipase